MRRGEAPGEQEGAFHREAGEEGQPSRGLWRDHPSGGGVDDRETEGPPCCEVR